MAADSSSSLDAEFPCSLVIHIPFPTQQLANAAVQALSVDQELSRLVRRSFTVVEEVQSPVQDDPSLQAFEGTILRTVYKATTNRMLRVAVNGFFDSLSTIIQVMDELDVDTLHVESRESLHGVQGLTSSNVAPTKS